MICKNDLIKKFERTITSFALQGEYANSTFSVKHSVSAVPCKAFSYKQVARGIFQVKGSSGEYYDTDTENWTCTCPSWYYSKNPKGCKHLEYLKDIKRVNR